MLTRLRFGLCFPPRAPAADLESIDMLESYIANSLNVLVYCSEGYFQSRNCVRELVAAHKKQTPVITLIDLAHKGGLSLRAIRSSLYRADELAVHKWNFKSHADSPSRTREYHGKFVWPGAEALHEYLFEHPAIEWKRIGHFQDVVRRGASRHTRCAHACGMRASHASAHRRRPVL